MTQKKLSKYLEVSDDVCSLAKHIVEAISSTLQTEDQKLSLRERVLFGLGKKIYCTFKALVEDVKKEHPEAMHHLKTMVESFIYLHYTTKGEDDINARLVMAKSIREKIKFFNANQKYPDQDRYVKAWEAEFSYMTEGIEDKWKAFEKKPIKDIADEAGLDPTIYSRVYKLACEPAHITDLVFYMPSAEGPINIDDVVHSEFATCVAIDYGLFFMCELLKGASDFYVPSFNKQISDLETKITTIRSLPSDATH